MSDDAATEPVTSFLESVETFILSAKPWLTDEDSPAITTLRVLAKSLDERMNGTLLQQFGLTYRNLLSRRPQADDEEGDELDGIIPG